MHEQEQGELAPLFSDLKAALQHFSDTLARECDKRYTQVCLFKREFKAQISPVAVFPCLDVYVCCDVSFPVPGVHNIHIILHVSQIADGPDGRRLLHLALPSFAHSASSFSSGVHEQPRERSLLWNPLSDGGSDEEDAAESTRDLNSVSESAPSAGPEAYDAGSVGVAAEGVGTGSRQRERRRWRLSAAVTDGEARAELARSNITLPARLGEDRRRWDPAWPSS